jgi:uncharacterized membrane protein YheB (UPF0754 family)
MADAVVAAARSDRAKEFYREGARRVVDVIMEREIGRIGDHVPQNAAQRAHATLGPPLWTWVQEQVPAIAQRVDIAAKVEQKILDYPIAQVEALIRGVTERELRLIIQLGWVLGAMIGMMSASIAMLF